MCIRDSNHIHQWNFAFISDEKIQWQIILQNALICAKILSIFAQVGDFLFTCLLYTSASAHRASSTVAVSGVVKRYAKPCTASMRAFCSALMGNLPVPLIRQNDHLEWFQSNTAGSAAPAGCPAPHQPCLLYTSRCV